MPNFIELQGKNRIYVPCLRTKRLEMQAFSRLSPQAMASILPAFLLGKIGYGPRDEQGSALAALRHASETAATVPFIVDLCQDENYRCDDLARYIDPENNFEAWRNLVARYPHSIPSVQMLRTERYRSILNQARALEEAHSKICIRLILSRAKGELETAEKILIRTAEPKKYIVIVDYGKPNIEDEASIALLREYVDRIRYANEDCSIVLAGSSYPRSVTEFDARRHLIPIEDIALQNMFAGETVYGDYAGIVRKTPPKEGVFIGPPQIQLPLANHWYFERRPKTRTAYLEIARTIVASVHWDQRFGELSWGAQQILEASQNDLDGKQSASAWTSARCNMHIERQIQRLTPAA